MSPPPEEVRAALERVLGSAVFVNAERQSRFLRHVVEQTLSGKPALLKEYSIGVEVFDRRPDYDPRTDAIVRNFRQSVGLAEARDHAADFETPERSAHLRQASTAAARAIEMDGELAEAHATLGSILLFRERDFAAAERHLRRAIQLDPRAPRPQHALSNLLSVLGRLDEAMEQVGRAQSLEPGTAELAQAKSQIYFLSRRYPEAIEEASRAVAIKSTLSIARWAIGVSLHQLGRMQEAERELMYALELRPGEIRATIALAHLLASTGRGAEAVDLLTKADRNLREAKSRNLAFALQSLGAGRKAEAIEWLERSAESMEIGALYIGVDPRFDALREEKRFGILLKKLSLP